VSAQSNLGDILRRHELITRFDKDGDGRLDLTERAEAQQWIRAERERSQGGRSLLRHARLGKRGSAASGLLPSSEVVRHLGKPWFSPEILRTVFLSLPGSDWHAQLAEFYRTDVELPGRLTVDGVDYPGVGVRYRGSSSYIMVSTLKKKSLNISVDFTKDEQRVYGNRTINFLNCNQDSSLIRDAVFSQIAGELVPTPRVNFVKLMINGANWGVYANVQQFNKDFLEDWFGSRKPVRWKIERNYRGVGALRYLGTDRAEYKRAFQLKSKGDPQAWDRLINLCRLLEQTPVKDREAALLPVLDVDRTLWFLALEWVFQDGDGYVKQGYDYRLVELTDGRFLPILYDNNEILPWPRPNRVPAQRRGQRIFGGDPLEQAGNELRPLIHSLLAVPAWRARYLAHVKTVATRCLDWEKIGPVCQKFHDLIAPDVKKDRRRLANLSAFQASIEELRVLCSTRRAAILAHPSLSGPQAGIAEPRIGVIADGLDAGRVRVDVAVRAEAPAIEVFLFFRWAPDSAFERVAMQARGDHRFVGLTSVSRGGAGLDYYVEARSSAEGTLSAFYPETAEARPAHLKIAR